MTPEQMQARSSEKVKQVLDMMKLLSLKVEAKQRLNPETGFIELMVYWTDSEKYPEAAPAEEAPQAEAAPEAPAEVEDPSVHEDLSALEPTPAAEEHA